MDDVKRLETAVPEPALRRILALDAGLCLGSAALFVGLGGPLAALTGLPVPVLLAGGLVCLGAAALMLAARARPVRPGLVALVVAGNAGWVLACLALALVAAPSAVGMVLLWVNVAAVGLLAGLEWAGLRGLTAERV